MNGVIQITVNLYYKGIDLKDSGHFLWWIYLFFAWGGNLEFGMIVRTATTCATGDKHFIGMYWAKTRTRRFGSGFGTKEVIQILEILPIFSRAALTLLFQVQFNRIYLHIVCF